MIILALENCDQTWQKPTKIIEQERLKKRINQESNVYSLTSVTKLVRPFVGFFSLPLCSLEDGFIS